MAGFWFDLATILHWRKAAIFANNYYFHGLSSCMVFRLYQIARKKLPFPETMQLRLLHPAAVSCESCAAPNFLLAYSDFT